jgi:hypothetical protein
LNRLKNYFVNYPIQYFKQIKKQVHELVFKNAYSHIQFMGESIRKQISEATDDEAKMVLCDKFVALKAAEMDALTNVAGRVDKNDVDHSWCFYTRCNK